MTPERATQLAALITGAAMDLDRLARRELRLLHAQPAGIEAQLREIDRERSAALAVLGRSLADLEHAATAT